MFNYESSNFKNIKNQVLCEQIKHLIECDILIVLGILFFYLKIAIIIEDCNRHYHDLLCNAIVKQILHNKSFDYDKITSEFCLLFNNLGKKTGSKPEYYDGFVIDRIKQIYDMLCEPIKYIKSLNAENLKKYVDQFPESSITMEQTFFYQNFFYLIFIYHQFGNVNKGFAKQKICMILDQRYLIFVIINWSLKFNLIVYNILCLSDIFLMNSKLEIHICCLM